MTKSNVSGRFAPRWSAAVPYDVNGRPEPTSRLRRLLRRPTEEITPGDPGLVPVAGSADDAVAASAVLDAAEAFDPEAQSVLRHLLELPAGNVDEVLRLVGQDNYVRVPDADSVDAGPVDPGPGCELVAVARVQKVDALHVSQERSRMAGVTARHGGRALLWQVLQIPG